jgi:3-hydroxybutyrate dehydrogenase
MQPGTSLSKVLDGRVALVTGSTGGIGLGIARALAASGAAVVLNGFGKPEEIELAQQAIGSDFGVPVAYSDADMSKPDSIAEMIDMTLAKFAKFDILVNNAGIQHVAPLQEFPAAKWDAIIAINLSSAFHTTRLALHSMIANKWGRVIKYRFGARPSRVGFQIGLCRRKTRHAWSNQSDRSRDGRAGYHL